MRERFDVLSRGRLGGAVLLASLLVIPSVVLGRPLQEGNLYGLIAEAERDLFLQEFPPGVDTGGEIRFDVNFEPFQVSDSASTHDPSTRADGAGGTVTTRWVSLYPDNMRSIYEPDGGDWDEGDLGSFPATIVRLSVRHELLHICCGHMSGDPDGEKDSCAHYKIAVYLTGYACEQACAAAGESTEPGDSADETRRAMCAFIAVRADFWGKNKSKARDCAATGGDSSCASSDCPQNLVPLPIPPTPGTPEYASWQPIQDCECCS